MSYGDDRIKTVAGADFAYEADARVAIGDGLVQAWLTLKPYPEGVDVADGSATLQKIVSITNVPGTGQITDTGAVNGSGVIRFDVTASNTTALGQRDYIFDVKAKTSAGAEFPVARGLWSNSGATTLST